MVHRLPTPGSDDGLWGDILNDFLGIEHNADGSQKTLDITKGGTGATSAPAALTGLGAVSSSDARLSDVRTPTDGSVTDVKVSPSAAITVSKLAAGSNGQVLTTSSGAPTWSTLSLGAYFNVKNYGATGDGSTDDTAAIASAISAANSAGGGAVYFPAGTYITSPQIHHTNSYFIGEGRASSVIKLKSGSNADLLVSENFLTNTGGSANGPSGFGLKDITLDANRTGQTSRSRCWVVYGYNYVVENVWFLNGYGGGVYSEWSGPDNPMEAYWDNVKIWNYGGTPGAVGLDWNGPHDSKFSKVIIATLDSNIRQTDVTFGATPINGNTTNFPVAGTPFTFATTAAAPTTLFPSSGGSFVAPVVGATLQTTWTSITYTSSSTVGSVTTFSGCTASVGNNRNVLANGGIVQPTYGFRSNLGNGSHGAIGEVFSECHIWGRNHFGWHPTSTIFMTNCEGEGAFIVNLILTTGSSVVGGAIYGTNGQAGQPNEVGIQIGTDQNGCGQARVDCPVHSIGGASTTSGASVVTASSTGFNVIRVSGSTSNATRYVNPYPPSSDIFEAICTNNPTLSIVAIFDTRITPLSNAIHLGLTTITYAASMTPDGQSGPWQKITVTDTNPMTINAPINPPSGVRTMELTIEILNSSGGVMGSITWNAAFVFAGTTWTNPANTKKRFARFEWNGNNWICSGIAAADY